MKTAVLKTALLLCIIITANNKICATGKGVAFLKIITGSASLPPVVYFTHYISSREKSDGIPVAAKRDATGYVYTLPVTGDFIHAKVPIVSAGKKGFNYTRLYLLQRGDSITLRVTDSLAFSGKGSDRMQCQLEVYRLIERGLFIPGEQRPLLRDSSYITTDRRKTDSVCALIDSLVSASGLDCVTQHLIALDAGGIVRRFHYKTYYNCMISNQYHRERDPSQSAEYYPVTHYRFTPATPAVSEPLSRYCARLAEELLLKEKLILMEWYYRRNTAQDSSFMPRLVAAVQKNYTGYTKEKMLAILFSESFYSSDTTDQLLNNAVNTARDTAMKEILRNIALVKMRGRPVLGFALPDSRGRTVKLSDFHGKIVIIDFWFTGCTTCVQLNRDMNKVVEHYKRDTGVVFISISADTDRKRWMQSLAGGKYTHASSVNLFTEGKGTEHPLLRYYNYLGFPRLMVVSGKGTLVTAHAPTPSDEEEMKKFISLVDGAER